MITPFFLKNIPKSSIWIYLVASVLTVATGVAPAVSCILLGKVFNVLAQFRESQTSDALSKSHFLHDTYWTTISLLLFGVAQFVCTWVSITLWMCLGEQRVYEARRHGFGYYCRQSFSWFESQKELLGKLAQTSRSFEEYRAGISEALALAIKSFVTVLSCTVVSFYHSPLLTLVILASIPLILVSTVVFGRLVRKHIKRENAHSAAASEILHWCLNASQLIKMSNARPIELRKGSTQFAWCFKNAIKESLASNGLTASLRVLVLMSFIQAFWFGNYLVQNKKATSGTVLVCLSCCLISSDAVSAFSQHISYLQKAAVSSEHVFAVSHDTAMVSHGTDLDVDIDGICVDTCQGEIEFQNVTFAYPSRPENTVLKNLTFNFKPKCLNFVLGASGSGKSTIASLLMRFYEAQKGQIMIDNVPLDSLSDAWLLKNVTLVQQESVLFHTSLKDNIAMGIQNYEGGTLTQSQENMLATAVDVAQLRQVVNKLSLGLETLIDVQGGSLSGGQQQRVALARALVRDSPILVLDEALSALDPRNRALVLSGIKRMRLGKTTIMISHHHEDIEPTDYVVHIQSGQVINSGLMRDLHSRKIGIQLQNESDDTLEKSEATTNIGSVSRLSSTCNNTFVKNEPMMVSKKPPGVFRLLGFVLGTSNQKPLFVLGFILALVNSALLPLFSYFLAKLISGIFLTGNHTAYNVQWSLITISVILADGITNFAKTSTLDFVTESWILALRQKIMENLIYQDSFWTDLNYEKSGELVSLVMNDTRDFKQFVTITLSICATVFASSGVGIVWAIAAGWKLALVGVSVFTLCGIVSAAFSSISTLFENRYKSSVAVVDNFTTELVNGVRTVQCFGLERLFEARYKTLNTAIFRTGMYRAAATGVSFGLSQFLSFVAQTVLLYYGLKLVGDERVYNSEQLMKVYTLIIFAITSIVQMLSQLARISRGKKIGTDLQRWANMRKSVSESQENAQLSEKFPINTDCIREFIKFDQCCFKYNENRLALNNASFSITKNQTVALCGESGSGKSTISHILAKLYPVQSGSVFIGGMDINLINTQDLRNCVSIVQQKNVFFKGTILENLTYGLPDYNNKDLQQWLKMFNLDNFIKALPNGLHTMIGDSNSCVLSGGQSQRLSIVRALLRKPKILILDECTSALDPVNSAKICEFVKDNLVGNKRGITTIIISHSSEMITIAEKVIYLKDGKIITS